MPTQRKTSHICLKFEFDKKWQNLQDVEVNGDCPVCRAVWPEAVAFAEACALLEGGKRDAEAEAALRRTIDLRGDWAAPLRSELKKMN